MRIILSSGTTGTSSEFGGRIGGGGRSPGKTETAKRCLREGAEVLATVECEGEKMLHYLRLLTDVARSRSIATLTLALAEP